MGHFTSKVKLKLKEGTTEGLRIRIYFIIERWLIKMETGNNVTITEKPQFLHRSEKCGNIGRSHSI